ncbi:CHAT domain-containing protein [uncultured Tenacibaculum sp.]|uniref:CHAT domain-containing protein n=1 Tax=uncultured Tenacibaculum sp. TaxID=174713 RepID=UPI00261D177F|nr:CHAT domain-containing protein [uncultured Tenacibaculum sp.]
MKKTNIYLLFFLVLFLNSIKSNSQFDYKNVILLNKHLKLDEKRADSILASINIKDTLFTEAAHSFSYFFYKKLNNYNLGIKYGKIEILAFENLNLNNKNYANALYNLGKFYYHTKSYNKAINYYNKVIITNTFPRKTAQAYCGLGYCFFVKGDYYKSINYFMKGLPLIKKYSTNKSVLAQYNNFSATCNKINTKESVQAGLFFLNKADSIIKNTSDLNIRKRLSFYIYNNFANLYSLKHYYNFEKAKYYYLKNLKESIHRKNDDVISLSSLNLGELYLNAKNDSCLYYFNKSLHHDLTNKNHLFDIHKNIANFHLYKKDYFKALKSIRSSLNFGFKVPKNQEIDKISPEHFFDLDEKRPLVKALKTKTEILLQLYDTTQKKEYLQKAIDNVQLTNKIVNILINYSTEANTKYLWRKEISETFNLGIYSAYLLNDSKLMFELMEKNKAFLLALNINENIKLTNLPDGVLRKNNVFKKDIFQLESEIETHKASKKKDSLFDLKVSYQNFKDSIHKIYPQFSNQNNNIKQVSFEQVKNNLRKKDIKIYYTLNASKVDDDKQSMLGLLISKNKDIRFKIKNIDSVLLGIAEYKKLISKPLTQKQELARFKKVSYSLYNQLFPTKEIKDLIKNKNISIVSDVSLENIPFEAFNTSATDLRYLVNDCNISYTYSSSFSEFNKNRDRKTNTDIVVFAPVNFKNTELSSLKNTEKEAAVITNLVGGDSFTNNNATKENFVRKTSNAKIIHLATHATATNNPSIQFFNDNLKLHELYTYKNNADLVVLSACETNIGELKQGEGVLNLARGFFHSGANAVVSSTWKINDASSSYIMKEFYTNLKNKQSKSEALNNAKRTYLKNHSLSEQSPYYWASFVLIGDTSPVFTTNYFYYVGIVLIIGLLVLFFFRRKLKLHFHT